MLALLVLPYQYREAKLGSSLVSGKDSCLPRPSITPRPPAVQLLLSQLPTGKRERSAALRLQLSICPCLQLLRTKLRIRGTCLHALPAAQPGQGPHQSAWSAVLP